MFIKRIALTCSLRVEDSINADFFYNKAIENDPNAAEAIVEMAKKEKLNRISLL